MSADIPPDAPQAGATPPPKCRPDLDTQMLLGCGGFVGASVGVYLLAVWPHLLWSDTHHASTLLLAGAFGLVPAVVFGCVSTRKFGLPGATGFLGGTVASGVFLYLRLQQVMAFRGIENAPQPDYPYAWIWLLPVGWLLLAIVLIVLLLPKGELSIEEYRD